MKKSDLETLKTRTLKLEEDYLKLHYQLEQSQDILTHISDGLILISSQGEVLFINEAAERLTGYDKQDVLKRPFWELFSDTLFGFSMKKALFEKEKRKMIFLNLKNGKKEHPLEVSFSEIRDKGVILVLRDATEMRKMKAALERNDRLKEIGEMAARLAHEIRNPLGGIQGFAQLLARDLSDNPSLLSMAGAILEGTRILNRLVTSVLHYAKPLEVHFSKCDLIALLQEVIAFAKEGEKTFHFTQEGTSFFAEIDRDLFFMALLNILKNASDATPEGKPIDIHLHAEMRKICISVTDYGEGITQENLEKIFTPFFTTKSQGTGLGLSEAHKVIEAHGGKIHVLSTPQKTTFTLKIPQDHDH